MGKEEQQSRSTEVTVLSPRALGVIDSLGIKFTDTQEVQWRIAERLAVATSVDDLLNGTRPNGLRDHLGEPFYIRGVDYLKSAFPGSPVFAVIDAVTKDGEPMIYTTGALSVVIQLAKGVREGWWDNILVKAEYSTEEPTADGNRPYRLARA